MRLAVAMTLLAQDQPRDTGPEFGKASPFGLLVVVLLLVGTFLLVRSMNRHLRKLPESFDPARPDQATSGETTPDGDPDAPTDGSKREPGG